MIDIKNVMSIYSGRPGCFCGCNGNHRYATAFRAIASDCRGYTIKDEEVSDRSVKIIVNKLNKLIDFDDPELPEIQLNDEFASFDTGTRTLVAYFVQEENNG